MAKLKGAVIKVKVMVIIAALCAQVMPAFAAGNEGESDDTMVIVQSRSDGYEDYLRRYDQNIKPQVDVVIPVSDYSTADSSVKILDNFEGRKEVVHTSEQGYIEWEVDVPQAGWYQIQLEYFPIEGRSSQIERQIEINGEIPFFDAQHILMSRVWANEGVVTRDNRDNDLRPRQVERPTWQTTRFEDSMGYYTEPYAFYFNQGNNTIKLTAMREPMVISGLKLTGIKEILDYKAVQQQYEELGYVPTQGKSIKLQGEDAQYKSDPTLYPLNDRSSPITEPYHPSKLRMNMIGAEQWKLPGQWIEWEVDVPEDGLYEISLKERQDMLRGSYSNRTLTIDGQVPFKEMESIAFKFNKEWNMKTLGSDQPYLFYLSKGKHQIRLEVSLGDLGGVLSTVEKSIYELNKAYRSILMLTGPQPDLYRDYQIEKRLPEVIETLDTQSAILFDVMEQLIAYTGKKGSEVSTIEKLAQQMKGLVKDPDTIPERLEQFKNNVASLGTWILTMREQPLAIDYILVQSPNMPKENMHVSLWRQMMHEVKSFTASFFEDYTTIGNADDGKESLEIWVMTGRDQAQIIKGMIEEEFTPTTGIGANVKLVDPSVLLPATVSGNGPDVAMQVPMADPVNYALRSAVTDISQFPDYQEIEKRFSGSALTPYRFNGGVYALPETQEFPMLFYRTDILEEMGLEVPQTWDALIDMLGTIQKNHMNFSIPVAVRSSAVTVTSLNNASGLPAYAMLLYQLGGQLYSEDSSKSVIDSPEGVAAFQIWTEFYVNYKLPLEYDFANRFRTGEIPIGIMDYSMYNRLAVFAPEIRGLWQFGPVPGMQDANGEINRSVPSTGVSIVMMEQSDHKDAAWEYMKWWTSKEMQVRFGREMESIMGAAARYPTANQEALAMLPWTVADYNSLMTQWKWVKGNPEVPGGYFTPRHLDNAFRKVVYDKEDPRETILDYVRTINEELNKKRLEFGLPTFEKGEE
ncbi:MAG: extracellular solute-binding protein [Cellulosilyticaceae bacterium]